MLKKVAIWVYLFFGVVYFYILTVRADYSDDDYRVANFKNLMDAAKSLVFPVYIAYDYYYDNENNLFHKKEIYMHNNHEIQREKIGDRTRINIFKASDLLGSGYVDNNECRIVDCAYGNGAACQSEDVAVMEEICKLISQKELSLGFYDYGNGLIKLEAGG